MTANIEALCAAAMLSIPSEYHDGVAENFDRLTEQARLLMQWKLPDDTEPAALFCP